MQDRIDVVEGDITKLAVDVIVNAANGALLGGGGVDGAIHRAAGPQLIEECRALGGCPTGEAKLTSGYALPAKWIVHAVGPVWHGGTRNEDALLAGCYRSALRLAREKSARSIAFPAISTGVYRFPLARATRIAVSTVLAELKDHALPERVVFACFGADAARAYHAVLAESLGA
jgi:O-acetyl-ADP-ribose deacetylase (regulator of RNase III)